MEKQIIVSSFLIRLDAETTKALKELCTKNERSRSSMIRVLIKEAYNHKEVGK